MALADDAQALSKRTRAQLVQVLEYHINTKSAWRLIQAVVAEGRHFEVHYQNETKKADEQVIGSLSQRYITKDLAHATLERLVETLEEFLVSLHRLWLEAYPVNLDKKSMSLRDIRSLPDKAAIVARFIDNELRDFAYKRPEEWFRDFEAAAKLACPTQDEIARVAEVKARRDVLVHNQGIANWLYVQKSGTLAAFADGARVEVSGPYLAHTFALIDKIIQDMTTSAFEKHSRS